MTGAGILADLRMNNDVAARLDELAALLEEQGANAFRVQAYRGAASTVRQLPESVGELLHREGIPGLDRLPGIGPTIARAIEQVVLTGRLPMLERLHGEHDPADVLMTVPGIGKQLAHRLHEALGIHTLEQLEVAAHDGRLARAGGFGEKRVAGIRDALATRLARRRRQVPASTAAAPSVAEVLDVDLEYRDGAAAGTLPRIAPRRFNPEGRRWLPVLHTTRGDLHYTALYSNTARAHQLGKTNDWVVLYFDGHDGERQHTVVTATSGPLEGRRVVRGRESECMDHYREHAP